MQYDLVVVVAKIHIVERHIAFQLCIGNGPVLLVGVLPRPHAGSLLCFRDVAVRRHIRVDQFHITVIFLRLFVQHSENTLRPGHGHDDAVHLLADLGHRLRKVLIKR